MEVKSCQNDFKTLTDLIRKQIGDAQFDERFEKAGLHILNGGRLYRDCKDLLFFYLLLFHCVLTNNFVLYNIQEGARIVPVIFNLSRKVFRIHEILNSDEKINDLCKDGSPEVDSIIFEMLVALQYLENGFDVEFIKKGLLKTPDIKITKKNLTKYVECKKLQRTNDYSYVEIDNWYKISDAISRILKPFKTKYDLHFTFYCELASINPKRVIGKLHRKLSRLISNSKSFSVANNKDFKIKATKIPESKFNIDLDPLRNISGPSFIYYLTEKYNPNYGYKVLCSAKVIGNFADNIEWASILSWESKSIIAIEKKSKHVKRHLSEAMKQLEPMNYGIIHILIEECNGE